MTEHEPLELFDYNVWANERLLACCGELSPDEWSRDLGGSFPTLLDARSSCTAAQEDP
jgi:uncharacterized damage-inducible protein DinB